MCEKGDNLMKLKTLLIINSVIAFPTGIACVLVPASLLSMYGITLIPMGLVIYQFWGATLLGLGMLTWFARNTKEPGVQKALALSLFITYGMSCFLAIRGQFEGANSLGWSTVALYVLLTPGFGYFRFMKLRRLNQSPLIQNGVVNIT
jgi:hypothetical protein